MRYPVRAASDKTIKAKTEPRLSFNSENFIDIISSVGGSNLGGGKMKYYDKSQVGQILDSK